MKVIIDLGLIFVGYMIGYVAGFEACDKITTQIIDELREKYLNDINQEES